MDTRCFGSAITDASIRNEMRIKASCTVHARCTVVPVTNTLSHSPLLSMYEFIHLINEFSISQFMNMDLISIVCCKLANSHGIIRLCIRHLLIISLCVQTLYFSHNTMYNGLYLMHSLSDEIFLPLPYLMYVCIFMTHKSS